MAISENLILAILVTEDEKARMTPHH